MNNKICFIGHRRLYDSTLRERLKKTIENEINSNCKDFMMGTHGEFDEMSLSVCRELRRKYPNIHIQVVITSLHKIKKELLYEDKFGKEYDEPYKDVETMIYDIEEEHFKRQITISNQKMIEECNTAICYVNRLNSSSGARKSLDYAKKKGLKIINLYDETKFPTYGMTDEEQKEYYRKIFEKI